MIAQTPDSGGLLDQLTPHRGRRLNDEVNVVLGGDGVTVLTEPSAGQQGVDVTLPSTTLIQFFNTADGNDSDDDYLINYFVCNPFPPADQIFILTGANGL